MPVSVADPHRGLAAAIISQAIYDWKKHKAQPNMCRNFIGFFNCNWFEDLCGIIDMNPAAVREKLKIAKSKTFCKHADADYKRLCEEDGVYYVPEE